jgi:hypothetical protein
MAISPAIHVRVSTKTLERLRAEEKEQNLNRSAIVTIALNDYFKKRDAERRKLTPTRGTAADRRAP